MTTDQFQQYLFKKITQIKSLTKSETSTEYKKAIQDVLDILDKERTSILNAHATLKDLGLTI
jgi:hypothetical protein